MAKRSKPSQVAASSGRRGRGRGPAKRKGKVSSESEDNEMDEDFKPSAAKRSTGGRASGRGQRKTPTASPSVRRKRQPRAAKRVCEWCVGWAGWRVDGQCWVLCSVQAKRSAATSSNSGRKVVRVQQGRSDTDLDQAAFTQVVLLSWSLSCGNVYCSFTCPSPLHYLPLPPSPLAPPPPTSAKNCSGQSRSGLLCYRAHPSRVTRRRCFSSTRRWGGWQACDCVGLGCDGACLSVYVLTYPVPHCHW